MNPSENKISIPELALVVLVGASGSGKSTFARRHFQPTEIISSDTCRGWVSDNENDQTASQDAFDVLYYLAAKRLARGRLTVIDATNVRAEARAPALNLAREYHVVPVALVLNVPEQICLERNRLRPERQFGEHVLRNQRSGLRRSLHGLQREGFRYVHVLNSVEEIERVVIERTKSWSNRKEERGPFDIIGDVHGCYEELLALLAKLGYQNLTTTTSDPLLHHPENRKLVFLGDLVDRGPNTPGVLRLAMNAVAAGLALCVPGNHDMKLLRKLDGKNVRLTHGLAETVAQLEKEPAEFIAQVKTFLREMISHYVLDEGKLVVAHAGMKESMQGRASGRVREFALYGETTGETDAFGLPVRYAWANDYRGSATVVYGHTPVPEAEWNNNTINIDTGCVFGGKLTALRYPEKELIAVPAAYTYVKPAKPFLSPEQQAAALQEDRAAHDTLELKDVLGKKIFSTRLQSSITIREEQNAAALEVMSRFALNPQWLVYLPPTMSPSETSKKPGLLEHPAEAFDYYRSHGVAQVICEEKHMGSRAIVIICRDVPAAQKRFGILEEELGVCYTRTGRRFFNEAAMEQEFLSRLHAAITRAQLWEELQTDWLCLDCELMPWSAKAQELLQQQYAKVGTAARVAFAHAVAALAPAALQNAEAHALLERMQSKERRAAQYVEAYRRYCWPVNSCDELKLAPFHVLASEGAAHVDKDHEWHMQTLRRLCEGGKEALGERNILHATAHKIVDVTDPESQQRGVEWWEELTAAGGEGMVVKPLAFLAQDERGLLQPALKCRGKEYLRLIYGLEYDLPEQLERLRSRGVGLKRALALREFALGVEALERFVRREPLYRVHECVFGVMALESEPVDPRL